MAQPAELLYSKEHEWVKLDGDVATVGITDYAQSSLGDIVYVELPRIGSQLEQGGAIGVVESVKAVSDVFAPLSGEVTAVNEALGGSPGTVNQSPMGEGWFFKLRLADPGELDALMDEAAYRKHVEGLG
jgi:glycine cleavage system H protein